MDKTILFVESDITTTRKQTHNNLVSFYVQLRMCFNETTLYRSGIDEGMYARFMYNDTSTRTISLEISSYKPDTFKSKWYKICNLCTKQSNKYLTIRTTQLLYDFEIVLHGAFKYECVYRNNKTYILIHY